VVVACALVLSAGAPPGAIPEGGKFPTGWLWQWLRAPQSLISPAGAARALAGLPQQHDGGRRTNTHTVGSAVTKAGQGSGSPRGHAPGALPPSDASRPPSKPRTTGTVHGDASFNSKTSKRVAGAASATSDVYANTDGTYTRKVFENPVNFKTADGTWAPIDNSLMRAGGRLRAKASGLGLSFAGSSGDDPLAVVQVDSGHALSYSLAGAAAVSGAVDGDTATYPSVMPGTDLRLTARATGVKESLVLHSPAAGNSWLFPLRLSGLVPSIDDGGSVLLQAADGRTVATIPAGHMEDAKFNSRSGAFTSSTAVRYELTTTADGQPALRVTADRGWLDDPARVYPVTVDPTTDAIDATGDTYALNTTNGKDMSGDNNLPVGTWNGGGEKGYSFLQFADFGASYSGAFIDTVSLYVYDTWAYTCTPEPFSVNLITQPWGVTGAKNYPGPSFGRSIGGLTADPGIACLNTKADRSVGKYMTVPLDPNPFSDWALSVPSDPNYGIALTASQTDSNQWKRFTSLDGPCCGPYLQVTYEPNIAPQIDAQYPPSGYTSFTLTPELRAAAHDPDAWPKSLTTDYLIFDKNGTKVADSGQQPYSAWFVPPGTLKWGETYEWTAITSDGNQASTSQTINAFTTQVPQPAVTSALSQNGSQGFDPDVGSYTTSATDATVATVGPPLSVQRSYNSLDSRIDSSFGTGWSSLLDMTATVQVASVQNSQSGTVIVRYPNGQDVAFGENADGTFTPPLGRYATLTRQSNGGYALVDKDGTRYLMDRALTLPGVWSIDTVTDAAGRKITFDYSQSPVTTITSASGRSLHFTFAPRVGATRAHVISVSTDPLDPAAPNSALTWHYTYSGNQLVTVCPPTSATACTNYSYANESRFPEFVNSLSPYSYWRLGEFSGTSAVSSVPANEGTDNGIYTNVTLGQPGPLVGSAATAAGFNGTSTRVDLPANTASSAGYQSIGLWFKANPGDSGVLFSYQRDPVTNGTTPSNYTPTLYIGTSGKLYGEFWNGIPHPLATPTSFADGVWHHVMLTAEGTYQNLFVDGVQYTDSLIGNVQPYDMNSGAHIYIGAGFTGGGWPDEPFASGTSNTGHASYFKGSISDVSFFDRPLPWDVAEDLALSGKSAVAMLSGVVRPSGNPSAAVGYDGTTGRVSQLTDSNGGTWKVSGPVYSGSSQVYAGSVLSAGPADYWRFAETGTADAVDQVHGGAARYNTVTLGTPNGPFADSTVAGFNGTSSYVSMPASDVPTTGPVSISMWFKMPSGNTAGGVLYGYQTADAKLNPASGWVPALYVGTDGKLRGQFWIANISKQIVTPSAVNDGKWHHVALAASTNSQSLYLDGARVGSALSAALVNPGVSANYVGAGKWTGWPAASSATIAYFPGAIADFAYYRSQLSDAQVAAQFAAKGRTAGAPVKTYTVTDPGNRTETRVYDLASNRQVAQTDSGGNRTQYGYDTGGFLRTTTDPNGNVTVNEHDVRGNVVSTSTCQNQAANTCSTIYYTYFPDDTTKLPPADPRNDLILTARDGRSTSATDNSYLTTYGYDATGNRTSIKDPLGRSTLTTYTDGTTVAAFDGGFAPPGLPSTLTTPGGVKQTVVYYRNGDIATVTDPAGKVTSYTYDALGRASRTTEVTDRFPAPGLVESSRYDGLNRVVSHTSPPVTDRVSGAVHTAVDSTVYDVDGLATSQQVADATGGDATRSISATYDAHGQASSTTDAAGNVTRFSYDAYGNVVDEIGADGGEVRSTFDGEGRLLTSTLVGYTGDPNKPASPTDLVVTSRAYDPAGRLATETDAMNWVTAYTYTDNNLTATVTRRDPSTGASFVQEATGYDAAGNATSQVTNNGSTKTVLALDAAGRAISSTLDPGGLNRTTTYDLTPDDYVRTATVKDGAGTVASRTDSTYDPMGRLTSQSVRTDSAGTALTTTYTLDQAGLAKSTTDPNGNTTDFDVDEAGRVVVSVAPLVTTETVGGAPVSTRPVASVGYDTFGEQVEAKDPDGNTTVTGYDAGGHPSTVTGASYTPPGASTPVVPVTTRTYDALGQLATETDPLGRRTSYVDDQLGHVAKVTAPNGGVTTFTYDLLGDQTSQTDPTGAAAAATYDFLGRQLTSTQVSRQDGVHYTTANAYTDPGGRLSSTTSPAGVITKMTYDAAGETLTVTDGAGNVTTNSYDAAGRGVRTLLPDGTYATTDFDLAGRPVGQSSFDAGGTRLSGSTTVYDGDGNVVAATDPRGTTKTFGYNASGLLSSESQPISGSDAISTSDAYDAAGHRTRFTDGRGNAFLTTYNSWGLPETTIEPPTATQPAIGDRTFTSVYDAAGRLAVQRAPGGVTVTDTYDDADDLTRQVGAGAEVATQDREFGYDLSGHLTSASAPGGTDTFSWDDRGLLRVATGPSGTSSFTYAPDGGMASRSDAAGTTTYRYDTAGRLAGATNPDTAVNQSYGYNSLSQLIRVTFDGSDGGDTRSFGYDGLHRLTSDDLKTPAGVKVAGVSYGYDANDNEISKTTTGFAGSTTNTYTYDLADRLTSWNNGAGTTVYAYDKSGNRVQAGDRLYTYDDRNQLVSASNGPQYHYTARGSLASVTDGGSTVTTQTDAFGQVVRQDGASTQTYAYDALGRLLRPGFSYTGVDNILASDGTAGYTRDSDGGLIGADSAGTRTYIWTDQHDDVVGQLAGSATALSGSAAYDPLGTVLARTGMLGTLGYQSEYTDPATGRVNMAARWYNPSTAQFDTRDAADLDPAPDSVDADRYAYAADNPLTTTDPTGNWPSWGGIKSGLSKAAHAVASGLSTAYHATVNGIAAAYHATVNAISSAIDWGVKKVTQVKNAVQDKIDEGRKWVAQQAEKAKQKLQQEYQAARQAGKAIAAQTVRVVKKTVTTVKDAAAATEKWVQDHKDMLIEVAAIGAGIVAGLACTAASAGTAAVACMIGAAAVINLAKDVGEGNIHNWGDAFASLGTGAMQGALGAVGGVVGGKLAGLAVARLGSLAGSLGGRVLSGALAGGIGDATVQLLTTGRVDWRSVGMSAAIGGVFGAVSKGGGCLHSFVATTRVLMADGSTRPIKDVNVGDKVATKDPTSGAHAPEPVVALHLNRDTDLTDVTVRTSSPRGPPTDSTLHTTQHHPFWDRTAKAWVLAAALVVGHQLLTDDGRSATVTAVANHTGTADMRDLTVADVHTYYVVAGDTPVLVHNCSGPSCACGPSATELRNTPGVASGDGLSVGGGNWLRGSQGNAGVFPRQIAGRLQGRTFDSFGDFRQAFWTEVGGDAELSAGFSPANIARMQNGNAPFTASSQQFGGGRNYVLHHVQPIQHGGGVYDMDNLAVVTPLYHSQILSPSYHYGNG
jgi:RHS repeat-associated protein